MYIFRIRWVTLALLVVAGGAFAGGWAAGVGGPGGLGGLGWGWPRAEPVSLALPVARGLDMPVFYVHTDQRQVALTFDISWGRQTAGPVLDILKEKGVRATFFLTGFWAKKQRDIAQRIVEDGHEIASHGDDHVNLSRYDGEAIAANILTAHRDLEEATGREARLFRPPNGDYDDLVVATARQLGYETIIWSLDTLDWKNPGADYMVRRVLDNVHPGDIILMHASDSSKQIHLALPRIIDGLRAQGYQLLTLGELMAAGTPARDDPRGRPRR